MGADLVLRNGGFTTLDRSNPTATVVAITHDERYLDELTVPARRIRMDEGRIAEEQRLGPGSPSTENG